ncbi:hypothetical protein SAMN05443580_101142 [Variovorax sp. OV084]|jgi:hypothetical protein|nr:hypothetical protein SAMN05443580_101142 [Variovorax sp. OV084]
MPPSKDFPLTRAELLRLGAALCASAALPASAQPQSKSAMNTRPIPSTQEALPVIGCGTWIGFDSAPAARNTSAFPACSTPCSRPAAR